MVKQSYISKTLLILILSLTVGCQYKVPFLSKQQPQISTPVQEYIPQQETKQTIQPDSAITPPNILNNQADETIKIAILLPLSGNYKELGQGLLNAAGLALFRIGDTRLELLPYDTKDSPTATVAAAKKAINEGAKIILGPVFSNGAKAIAKIAADNNIQVVSFSNDKSLAGSGVFAIGFLPEQQVRRVVQFVNDKGINNLITLLPGDAYGTIVTKELQEMAVANQAIAVIKNQTYQTDAQGRPLQMDTHVQEIIKAAKNSTNGAPTGLLMPASNIVTTEILNLLTTANYDKSKIQLLGADQWRDKNLLANNALEGAMFAALPSERRHDFENKFKETYGNLPPKLSGLAFDGIALAATLARNGGAEGFTRQALTNPRGFVGVDGIFRLEENGLATRGFAVMAVKGGRAIVIDPAPASFGGM